MFEDAVGWLLMVATPVLVIGAGYWTLKKIQKKKLQAKLQREQALEQLRQEREASKARWKERLNGATHVGKTTYDYNADVHRTTVTERGTNNSISYVHTNDTGPDLLTTMIVAELLKSKSDTASGSVSWDNDVPKVKPDVEESKPTSSFGSYSSPSWDDDGPSKSSSSWSGSSPSSSWDSSSSDSSSSSSWD